MWKHIHLKCLLISYKLSASRYHRSLTDWFSLQIFVKYERYHVYPGTIDHKICYHIQHNTTSHLRKNTGSNASQQILLDQSLSTSKKTNKKNLLLGSTGKVSTTNTCIAIVLSLEIHVNMAYWESSQSPSSLKNKHCWRLFLLNTKTR